MKSASLTTWICRTLEALGIPARSLELRRCARNAAYSSLDYGAVLLLWVVATPVFVSRLGPGRYGLWMLVNGLMGFTGVASLGLTQAAVRYVARYRALRDNHGAARVVRVTATLYFAVGAVSALTVASLAPWLVDRVFNVPAEDAVAAVAALRLGGAGICARFFNDIFRSALHGFERFDLAARAAVAVNAISIATGLVLVLLGHGLLAVLAASVAATAAGGLVQAALLKRLLPEFVFRPSLHPGTIRETFGFGVFCWLQTVLGIAAQNADAMLLASLLSPAALTYYSISKRIASQGHVLLSRGLSFLFPLSGTLSEGGQKLRLRRLYDNATAAVVIAAAALTLPLYAFGDSLFSVWLGDEFTRKATVVLRILCVRHALLPMGIVNYHYLHGTGLVRFQAMVAAVTAPLMIAGMFFLIPVMGVVGAAVAQLFSLPVMLFTRLWIEKKLFDTVHVVHFLGHFLPVVVPFLVITALLRFTPAPRPDGWVPLIALLAAAAAATGGLAFWITLLCRRLSLIPA